MDPDKLDEFIKKQVGEHHSSVDPDLLWQNIQAKQEVKEESKRRFLIFWFFGGISLFAGLVFLYNFQFSDTNKNQENQRSSPQERRLATDVFTSKAIEKETAKKSNIAQEKATNLMENQTTQSTALTQENKQNPSSFTKSTNVKSVDPKSTIATENKFKPSTTIIHSDQLKTKNSFPKKESVKDIKTINDANKTIVPPLLNLDKGEANPMENNEEAPATTSSWTEDKEEILVKESKNPINNDPEQTQIIEGKIGEEVLNNPVSTEQPIDRTSIDQQEEKLDTLYAKKEDHSSNKKWQISSIAGITYGKALRTFSAKSTAPMGYLQMREDSETPLDVVRVNANFMMQHRSGFYWKSGLEYQQINERFDYYVEWDSTQVTPDQLLAIAYDKTGSFSERRGNGEVVTKYWLQKKIYNHYRSMDIPLLIGYHSVKKDKSLAWFVEGGVSVNVWFKASGEILGRRGTSIRLEDNDQLFHRPAGLSLTGAGGLTYRVGKQLRIWASPGIKYQLRSVMNSKISTIEQKYLNLGFRVGVQYQWLDEANAK